MSAVDYVFELHRKEKELADKPGSVVHCCT